MSGTCDATIHSPWRRGMVITCQNNLKDHAGMHGFRLFDGREVHWTGQDDKLTAMTRRREGRQ